MRVRIEELKKVFRLKRQELVALDGVNLDVRDQEFMAVVGPNACGKSTLLRLVAGLETPTSGTVKFLGTRRAESLVSMVWQTAALLPWRKVDNNVALPPEFKDKPRLLLKRITNRFLNLARLKEWEEYYPHQLSSGMKQRTDIARALANDPEVLLMDEPFANLDALTRGLLRQELLNLWEREKKTVIFVTHDLEEAVLLSDRVAVMTAAPGKINEVVEVNLPRPRNIMTQGHPSFARVVARLWCLLEADVRMTMEARPKKD